MTSHRPRNWRGALLCLFLLTSVAPAAQSGPIQFEDATSGLGLPFTGPSFGAGAWGDWDGDGLPDLWLGNHANHPSLYYNLGDGAFKEASRGFWIGLPNSDTHGAAWADFDHDGDLDLVELVGAQSGAGTGPNHLFLNEDGFLIESASLLGVDYPLARGRTPFWVDWDLDGDLDLVATGLDRAGAETALFTQGSGAFSKAGPATGFDPVPTDYHMVQFSDLDEDGNLDLLLQGYDFPIHAYDLTQTPMVDIAVSSGFPLVPVVQDTVFADFNGDLVLDTYHSRYSAHSESEVGNLDAQTVQGRLIVDSNELGFLLGGGGVIQVELPELFPLNLVFLGSTGGSPAATTFSLDPSNPAHQGIKVHTPGADNGLFIGWNTSISQWEFFASAAVRAELVIRILGASALSVDDTVGFLNREGSIDKMVIHQAGSIFSEWAVPFTWSTRSVVAGDFDNDMDQDLYLVASGSALNRPNILLENQGDGTMVPVAVAGGAAGPVTGIGDSVSTVDYDQDGYLDLLVTNGDGNALLGGGPGPRLFHNLGGANHWLEIDLEGVVSNRDAIGARVIVTTSGVSQLREQAHGVHRFTQNHARLHYGLGTNTMVDQIRVEWPSGAVQTLTDLPADQVVHIYETTVPGSQGPPDYQAGVDEGVYLWKDSFDGPYQLRISAGANLLSYDVRLVTERGLGTVNGFNLTGGDLLQNSLAGFSVVGTAQAGEEGADFELPANVRALLSVELNGKAHTRQLMVGGESTYPVPAGWVLQSTDLLPLPSQLPPPGIGLAIASPDGGSTVEARWDGLVAGPIGSESEVAVLSSQAILNASRVGMESGEKITRNLNAVATLTNVALDWDWDGFDVELASPGDIGVYWKQDGLFQPRRVLDPAMKRPNAYLVPLATPYGFPNYDPGSDTGVFLWRDLSGVWHLRVMSGNTGTLRYTGSIVSDQNWFQVIPATLEPGDILDTSNPKEVHYDFTVDGNDVDGFDFLFPLEATQDVDLKGPGVDPVQWIRVGEERWQINQVPFSISGW